LAFNSIKGFKDILPEESGWWQRVETAARRIYGAYGFQEIKTPVMEWTELFSRGIGEETDIVSKEMYTLTDSKGRGMTLRPEATASVVRAYIQHRLYGKNPVQKLFTIGPMFRHEQPQLGRFRQFHQINAEVFGSPGPRSDAELIAMAMQLFRTIGLAELRLHVNALGCPACRPRFRDELRAFLKERTDGLCADCLRRREANPLRVFDCKVEGCKSTVSDAPSVLAYLCGDCTAHFDAVKGLLQCLDIPFIVNHKLVRGLDYYNRTTFEIQTERLGAQNAVAGGGRYDGLVKLLGGPDHPAIGFAVGMERVVALLQELGGPENPTPDLYIAALGDRAESAAFQWAFRLRQNGLRVEMSYESKSLKAQMKQADRLGATHVLIVGDNELDSGAGQLRDMDTKAQTEVGLADCVERLTEMLR
jgi:histidyl-tRNA synthetase